MRYKGMVIIPLCIMPLFEYLHVVNLHRLVWAFPACLCNKHRKLKYLWIYSLEFFWLSSHHYFFCPENVVDWLHQCCIFIVTQEHFFHRSMYYEPWSDCSKVISLIWVLIVCNIGYQNTLAEERADINCHEWWGNVNKSIAMSIEHRIKINWEPMIEIAWSPLVKISYPKLWVAYYGLHIVHQFLFILLYCSSYHLSFVNWYSLFQKVLFQGFS